MSPTGINLPCLCLAHTPQLDEPIIASRDDEWQCGMKSNPVHTSIMALENKLNNCVRIAKHVCLLLVGTGHLVLKAHRCWCGVLFPQAGNVPYSN